jgi:hypothetical protein
MMVYPFPLAAGLENIWTNTAAFIYIWGQSSKSMTKDMTQETILSPI